MSPTSRVRDVAPLRDGRVLVSLGGSVRLYTPGGAPSFQFSCQAETLVCSSDGRRAIAVSGVSRLRQLTRLDLHEGIARPWCEVEIEVFARTFEGRLWYVATEGSPVMGIDTEAPGFEIATRGEKEMFWPVFLRPLPDQLYLMSTSLGAEHVELYQLPSLALVGGSLVPKPDIDFPGEWICGELIPPTVVEPVLLVDDPRTGKSRVCGPKGTWAYPFEGRSVGFDASGAWAGVLLRHQAHTQVVCFHLRDRRPVWSYTFATRLEGSILTTFPLNPEKHGGVRIEQERLAAWDSSGQVVIFNLAEHRLEMELRV